jgi:translation initiation factor IF-1
MSTTKRNQKGGSGYKKQAGKDFNYVKSKTRIATDEYEFYGKVVKMLGGVQCHVLCDDNKLRLCIIRGKFTGKKGRQDGLAPNKWVLIGLRDFETQHDNDKKLDKCDLLEIYNDIDKEYLKSHVNHACWDLFEDKTPVEKSCEIGFSNMVEEDYNLSVMPLIKMEKNGIEEEGEEFVSFDDI